MPLKATRVIHRDWSLHHQPTAESAMTATCDITRPPTATGTLNTTTGAVTNPATTLHTGVPARVQSVNRDRPRTAIAADDLITEYDYLVQVPADLTDLRIADVLTFTASPGDPSLIGAVLRVTTVILGSEGFTLDLGCRLDA